MTDRTKYIAIIVGGTPEEPWDVEREYYATSIVTAAALAQAGVDELNEGGHEGGRVTSVEEVL